MVVPSCTICGRGYYALVVGIVGFCICDSLGLVSQFVEL